MHILTRTTLKKQLPKPPGHWVLSDNELSKFWVEDSDESIYSSSEVGGIDPLGHYFPEVKQAGK